MLAALNDKSQLGACPLVPNHTAVFISPKTDANKRDNSMLTVCPYVCMSYVSFNRILLLKTFQMDFEEIFWLDNARDWRH